MSVENGSNLGSPAKRKSGMLKPKFKEKILNLWRICPVAGSEESRLVLVRKGLEKPNHGILLLKKQAVKQCVKTAKKTDGRAGSKIADLERVH